MKGRERQPFLTASIARNSQRSEVSPWGLEVTNAELSTITGVDFFDQSPTFYQMKV